MIARIAYVLAALGATGGAAWFAYRKTEEYFVFNQTPLPFERFGLVAALGAAFVAGGLLMTIYRLIFEFNRRDSA